MLQQINSGLGLSIPLMYPTKLLQYKYHDMDEYE